jgi:peptidoglycan/xylan/chitin deacetylase (PgdA/CDA1 family)
MLAVTIDMDGPREYAAIHGLRMRPNADTTIMYGAPLERFASLCEKCGVLATLFVVGRDLGGSASERLRDLAGRGFEVASHSHSHDYELTLLPPMHIEADVARACAAHESSLGVRPVGFRAPGHHLSGLLLDELEAQGIRYSSSVLPSPPYYAAKALAVGGYRALGQSSRAILGSPRIAWSPRHPYHPGRDPYREGERALVELPIAVATRARLPVTGASLALAPDPLRRRMVRSLVQQPVVVLNLHAMDLVDAEADRLPPPLAGRQPELRIPVIERLRIFAAVIEELAADHEALTCADIACQV